MLHRLSLISSPMLDVINKSPNLDRDITYIWNSEIKGDGQLLFMFPGKLLYNVCLIRIKVEVDERRNTVDTHMNDDCLLKDISMKQNK